jgi:hypothetical protein
LATARAIKTGASKAPAEAQTWAEARALAAGWNGGAC